MTRTYVPPLTPAGSSIAFTQEDVLAPGVYGYAIKVKDGRVFIPDIRAMKVGTGAVSRFLDRLAPNCCVVNVISSRLRNILRRKGWLPTIEDGCDVWQKPI